MKHRRITIGASEEAHVSSSALGELEKAASKHACPLPHMVFIFVLGQLAALPSRSDLRTLIPSLVGPEFRRCLDALVLEGLVSDPSSSSPDSDHRPISEFEPAPLDSLCAAWREMTGESVPAQSIKRLSSQVCSKYGTLSVRNAPLAARMFRSLFPQGTFFSFVNDAHRYAPTMDSASLVWEKFGTSSSANQRWASAWTTAKSLCPADYGADDPYLFVPASNPRFSLEEFGRLAGTVDLRDALALAAAPVSKKRAPTPGPLTGIGGML